MNEHNEDPSDISGYISSKKVKFFHLLGAFIGFLIGVLGNILAAWLLNDIIKNEFTIIRVGIIIILSIFGLLISVLLVNGRKKEGGQKLPYLINGSGFYHIRLWWTKMKAKGNKILIHDLFSLGSKIEIDTDEKSDDE